MAGPESLFWRQMKKEFLKLSPLPKMNRIESKHAGGFPDVVMLWKKKTFFIELKVSPYKNVRRPKLSEKQIRWHVGAHNTGAKNVFTVISVLGSGEIQVFNCSQINMMDRDKKIKPGFVLPRGADWSKVASYMYRQS